MEGAVVGSYRVQRKLGEGGMGAVYLAEHALLGRRAAIKVLLPALSADQEIVNRFFNEARAATSIDDPGIVQIFDFGYAADGSAFIVMELLEGEPLDARLARLGALAPSDVLRLSRQVAASLAAAHARGIIHRDLKPENIFLVGDTAVTGGERPKILDFGIAKLADDTPGRMQTRAGAIMGTPVYMSPEQCKGAGAVDHRSDIYALGCVMFQLLTGTPPFDGCMGEIIAAHLFTPPPLASSRAPGVPPAVDAIVARCLSKIPDDRYASMSRLVDAIAEVESVSLGVTTYLPAPTPAPSQKPSRGRAAWYGIGGAVAIGIAVALFLLLGRGNRDGVTAVTPDGATVSDVDPAGAVADAATGSTSALPAEATPVAGVVTPDASNDTVTPGIDAGSPPPPPSRSHRRHKDKPEEARAETQPPPPDEPGKVDRGD
jgi:serine/threonine protein kinase